MSDELKKYRSVLLDEHSSESNFRSEMIEVVVGEQTMEVMIRALSMAEFNNPFVPDELIDKLGQQEALKLTLVTKCARVPATGERIFRPPKSEDNPGDVFELAKGPMYGNGPVARMFSAVNYVHGFQTDPPQGVIDPRLEEIAEAAEHLEELAGAAQEHDEDLHAGEVSEMAQLISSRVRWIDHGSTEGK